MRRAITAVLVSIAAACATWATQADVTVLAVRLGAKDVVALAKFYDAAFGLKEIDRTRSSTSRTSPQRFPPRRPPGRR